MSGTQSYRSRSWRRFWRRCDVPCPLRSRWPARSACFRAPTPVRSNGDSMGTSAGNPWVSWFSLDGITWKNEVTWCRMMISGVWVQWCFLHVYVYVYAYAFYIMCIYIYNYIYIYAWIYERHLLWGSHYRGFRMFWVNIWFLVASYRMPWHVPVVTAVWNSLNQFEYDTWFVDKDDTKRSCSFLLPRKSLELDFNTHTHNSPFCISTDEVSYFSGHAKNMASSGFPTLLPAAPSSSSIPRRKPAISCESVRRAALKPSRCTCVCARSARPSLRTGMRWRGSGMPSRPGIKVWPLGKRWIAWKWAYHGIFDIYWYLTCLNLQTGMVTILFA